MKLEDELLFEMYEISGYTDCPTESQKGLKDSKSGEKGISTCPENKVSLNA